MVTWNNLDKLTAYEELKNVAKVNLKEAMSGDNGAKRVVNYNVPMAGGLKFNYAAKQVDDAVTAHYNDETHEHIVQPKMVYISNPTEFGTLYTKAHRNSPLPHAFFFWMYRRRGW